MGPFGNLSMQDVEQLFGGLFKSFGVSDAANIIPQDLEPEAYITLYRESDPTESRLLKTIPKIPATSITHEFNKITAYSGNSQTGFVSETGTVANSKPTIDRVPLTIRLMADRVQVTGLSNLQRSNRAFGLDNLVEIVHATTRLNFMRKMNQQIYKSDTRDTYASTLLRFKGIYEQIDTGTSGSAVDHIVDMQGYKVTASFLREKAREITELYGTINVTYVPPICMEQFEKELDPAERLIMPSMQPVPMLQRVPGFWTQSGFVKFEVDNSLSAQHYRGAPPTAQSGAPSAPTVNTVAHTADASSLWFADDEARVSYKVTAVRDEVEGAATEVSTADTVAAGDKVTFRIIPPSGDPVDSFKIYRGVYGTSKFEFIQEVAWDGASVQPATYQTFTDLNTRIPGTTEIYGMNMRSTALNSLSQGPYDQVVASLDTDNRPLAGNTISLAVLGPFMATFPLAKTSFLAADDLIFTALTPEVSVPTQNFILINVGTRE